MDRMEGMIREAAALDTEIRTKSRRLRELKSRLADSAHFQPGSRTGYITGGGFRVKIQLRDQIKWDQDRLRHLKARMPDFSKLFKTEYKPVNKKVIDGYLSFGPHASVVKWAISQAPTHPQVSFISLAEQEDSQT